MKTDTASESAEVARVIIFKRWFLASVYIDTISTDSKFYRCHSALYFIPSIKSIMCNLEDNI